MPTIIRRFISSAVLVTGILLAPPASAELHASTASAPPAPVRATGPAASEQAFRAPARETRAGSEAGATTPGGTPGTAAGLLALAGAALLGLVLHLAAEASRRRVAGLEERLLRETAARERLEQELRQAETFAGLGRLAGGLAHELGSPLNVIAMRAEAILADSGAPVTARNHAQEILAETDRVGDLVRGLLHVARRDAVGGGPVDLAELAVHVLARVRGSAERSDVRLELDADAPALVPGNVNLLRHALLNLVVNAVHAASNCPGERRVRLRVERSGREVRALVEDTGPGIAAEHLPHVFEPFFTTKAAGEGTGLGLAITRAIAEAHGGCVQPQPRDGHGLRMALVLPACAEPAPPEPVRIPVLAIPAARQGTLLH